MKGQSRTNDRASLDKLSERRSLAQSLERRRALLLTARAEYQWLSSLFPPSLRTKPKRPLERKSISKARVRTLRVEKRSRERGRARAKLMVLAHSRPS